VDPLSNQSTYSTLTPPLQSSAYRATNSDTSSKQPTNMQHSATNSNRILNDLHELQRFRHQKTRPNVMEHRSTLNFDDTRLREAVRLTEICEIFWQIWKSTSCILAKTTHNSCVPSGRGTKHICLFSRPMSSTLVYVREKIHYSGIEPSTFGVARTTIAKTVTTIQCEPTTIL
jgi:hypothetical protein